MITLKGRVSELERQLEEMHDQYKTMAPIVTKLYHEMEVISLAINILDQRTKGDECKCQSESVSQKE